MTAATGRPPAPVAAGAAPEPLRPDESRLWKLALAAPLVLGVPWLLLALACRLPDPLQGVSGVVLALLVVTTTVTDLRRRRIPNWATYTATAWALALALGATIVADRGAMRMPLAADPVPGERLLAANDIGTAAGGFGIGFGVMFVLYGIFRGGAGDVKLAGALGALVGSERILNALVYGYIVAGVAVACWLVVTFGPVGLFREVARGLRFRRMDAEQPDGAVLQRKLAMAPFLNAGVLLALFW